MVVGKKTKQKKARGGKQTLKREYGSKTGEEMQMSETERGGGQEQQIGKRVCVCVCVIRRYLGQFSEFVT